MLSRKKAQNDEEDYFFSINGELIPLEVENVSKKYIKTRESIVIECSVLQDGYKSIVREKKYLERVITLPFFNLSYKRRIALHPK